MLAPYSRRPPLAIILIILIVPLLLLPACAPDLTLAGATATPAPTPTALPTPFAQGLAQSAWEDGAHAHTYALEKGPNTYCARCHAPLNWDPAATVDPPPNCVSCKFPNEPEPRQAAGNPMVPAAEWRDITCQNCHRVTDGLVDAEIAWYDQATGYYETVASATDLCRHCHQDTETLRHNRDTGSPAHVDFDCTDCHDPHNLLATCAGGGCHVNVPFPLPPVLPEHLDQVDASECTQCHQSVRDIHMNLLNETPTACMECHDYLMGENGSTGLRAGHDASHAEIACTACHDASDLPAGPLDATAPSGPWVSFRTTLLLGRNATAPYTSHTLQQTVDCTRCHYADNPWGLAEETDNAPTPSPAP